MGLFSEIGRAWLTIDSDIYVSIYRLNSKTDFKNYDEKYPTFDLIRSGAMNMAVMWPITMDWPI